MKQKIFIYLFDGFSDWEISYLSPEINKSDKFELVYFSDDGNAVTSMGGLKVLPDISLAEINADKIEMLILPGGTIWETGANEKLATLVQTLWKNQKSIAAICAATTYLARLGILDNIKHTSNDLYYLKAVVPSYSGDNFYINSPAVSNQNIITANGPSSIEFAREIFQKIKLYSKEDIEKWFQLFKHGIWSE